MCRAVADFVRRSAYLLHVDVDHSFALHCVVCVVCVAVSCVSGWCEYCLLRGEEALIRSICHQLIRPFADPRCASDVVFPVLGLLHLARGSFWVDLVEKVRSTLHHASPGFTGAQSMRDLHPCEKRLENMHTRYGGGRPKMRAPSAPLAMPGHSLEFMARSFCSWLWPSRGRHGGCWREEMVPARRSSQLVSWR